MKVLVTGASGFIGTHLVPRIVAGGSSPVCVGRDVAAFAADGFEAYPIFDLQHPDCWANVRLLGVDAVVHAAGVAHLSDSKARSLSNVFQSANEFATVALFRACQAAGVRRFVFVSSIGVNGTHTQALPFSERDHPAPEGPYAQSKLQAELALQAAQQGGATDLVIVRPSLCYGRSVKGNLLRLMRMIRSGLPIPVTRHANERSLLHVDGLCDLLLLCAQSMGAAGQIFVAADAQPVSTLRLCREIAEAMNCRLRTFRVSMNTILRVSNAFGMRKEVTRMYGSLAVDSSKARALLGWRDSHDFHEGIVDMVDEFLANSI